MECFLDTNIFLRFFVDEPKAQHEQCRQLFAKISEGKLIAVTCQLAIFEVIWTLQSYYDLPKQDIIDKVFDVLVSPNVLVDGKDLLLSSLLIWQVKNIKFNDIFMYNYLKVKGLQKIYSYDKDFNKFADILRLES
jgi:predicted nucleic acid-binding protein